MFDGASAVGQSNNRPMQGQSPYILNAGIFYNNIKSKFQVNLLYNVSGKHIAFVGTDLIRDIYEMPRNVVDLVVTKNFTNKLPLKANFNDLLNQKFTLMQDGNQDGNFDKSVDQVTAQFRSGRQVGLTLSYRIL